MKQTNELYPTVGSLALSPKNSLEKNSARILDFSELQPSFLEATVAEAPQRERGWLYTGAFELLVRFFSLEVVQDLLSRDTASRSTKYISRRAYSGACALFLGFIATAVIGLFV